MLVKAAASSVSGLPQVGENVCPRKSASMVPLLALAGEIVMLFSRKRSRRALMLSMWAAGSESKTMMSSR